ncbi:hypothetical protein LUZ60_002268 [Juncus effusus]|nr:hypothetical protein LUZ60_002268 [Juncus effusus]
MSTFLSLLLFLTISHLQPSLSLPKPNHHSKLSEPKKLIFILAGQSNMAGRGGVRENHWDHFVPPESQPNQAIQRLSRAECWEEAREPLDWDIDVNKTCGVGPGMAFANSISNSAKQAGWGVIGLVPCAVGGTSILQWTRGTILYNQMISRANRALTAGGGTIGAVLWYQGESDTVKKEDAELYFTRFERFISDVRMDLNLPNLPYIQVGLASGEGPYVEIVRKAQKEIKLPNVKYVDAMGLKLENDHLHLTTKSQVQLGKMLARSYLNSGIKDHWILNSNIIL